MAQDDDSDRALSAGTWRTRTKKVFKEHFTGSFRCSAQRVPLCAASSAQFCEWVQALSQQEQVRGEPLELFQDSGIRRVVSTRVPTLSSPTSADAHPHVVDFCSGKGRRP